MAGEAGLPAADTVYAEVEAAYDEAAGDYDRSVGTAPSAARARAAALRRIQALAGPGARLLDVGCGTGADALALAHRGYRVLGIDSAAAMVAQADARRVAARLPEHACSFRQMRAAELGVLADEEQRFDVVFSTYAVLNLEPRLDDAVRGAAALVRPGGAFVVGLLNPTALFEVAAYPFALRLKGFRKAAQRPVRLKLATGGERDVPCFLFGVDAFAERLAPWFALEEAVGLHVFLPPLRGSFLRFATLWGLVGRFEEGLEARFPWNRLGYFSLLTFRRTGAELPAR